MEAQRPLVQTMCDQIRHRGPDDQGFHVEGPCAIEMRRLSIIDLDTGRQPISNEDGTLSVVFNGEIYNYRELRAALAQQGHRFATASDTEVLVHLYEQEGVEGLSRLRGMFAFAIWDSVRRQLRRCRRGFASFKLFEAGAAKDLFGRQMLDGFGFDVEVLALARARGYRVVEVPVRWDNAEGTKVGLGGGLDAFADLLRVRWNLLRGRYGDLSRPAPGLVPAERFRV